MASDNPVLQAVAKINRVADQALGDWDHTNLPFIHDYTYTAPIVGTVLYLTIICYVLPLLMKNREPIDCKPALIAWNFALFFFSFVICTFYIFAHIERSWGKSVYFIICDPEEQGYKGAWAFYAWAFLMSKFVEFGDTVFLVIRKRPVIFLHWYHHATVLIYTWISVVFKNSLGMFFGLINAIIHSFMYYYYFRTAQGHKIWWAKYLTIAQLTQMAFGIAFLCIWIFYWNQGLTCSSSSPQVTVGSGLIMYGSYFVLFYNLFTWKYSAKKPKTN